MTEPGAEIFAECCHALWGDDCTGEAARALGVSYRRVRRWMTGDKTIPPGVWADLHKLMAERHAELAHLMLDADALSVVRAA